jgi:glycosyltransferase involved in cell wall biosynthesis
VTNNVANNNVISDKEPPLVSIIMNCYNGERYLSEAIDSIYSQTYKNWEIIFWDNASIDMSGKIAKSYDDRLKYFSSKSTVALGKARNFAIKECNGDLISFLDCDDIWLPHKLELQVKEILLDSSCVVCYSDGYYLQGDNKTEIKFSSGKNTILYQGEVFDKLICTNFINWQTVLINKKMAEGNLFFNENLSYAEDHEILLRLSLIGNFKRLNFPLVYYRVHDNNISNDYRLILSEFHKVLHFFKEEIEDKNININMCLARMYGSVVIKLAKDNKNIDEVIGYLMKYPNTQNVIIYFMAKIKILSFFIKR